MAEDNSKTPKTPKPQKYAFIARIALRGDFETDDGLGTAQQEVAAGQRAVTEDKKLYESLIEQGYAKAASKNRSDDGDDKDEVPATSSGKSTAVKTTDK